MAARYTIDEFVAACQAAIADAGITQTDARAGAAPDARTVRYYQSLGLLSAPEKDGRQAAYSDRHVREVVAVKRAQAAGCRLGELAKNAGSSEQQFWATPTGTDAGDGAQPPIRQAWTRNFGTGAVLIVPGNPPTDPATIAALDAALRRVATLLEQS